MPEHELAARILNACYLVRGNARPHQVRERELALEALGLVCRDAFNQATSYAELLEALRYGLDDQRR